MKKIEIYDPALCCSSGVCGPSPDQTLIRFSSVVETLKAQNVDVKRFNLTQEPMAFANNAVVKKTLEDEGDAGLPLTFIDGSLHFRGVYPTLEQLQKLIHSTDESPSKPSLVKIKTPNVFNSSHSCDNIEGCC